MEVMRSDQEPLKTLLKCLQLREKLTVYLGFIITSSYIVNITENDFDRIYRQVSKSQPEPGIVTPENLTIELSSSCSLEI